MTTADNDTAAMETTIACFRGYADCVKGAKEMDVIWGIGVCEKGEINDTPAVQNAYNMELGV